MCCTASLVGVDEAARGILDDASIFSSTIQGGVMGKNTVLAYGSGRDEEAQGAIMGRSKTPVVELSPIDSPGTERPRGRTRLRKTRSTDTPATPRSALRRRSLPVYFADVVEELKGLRRDMVVLCRVIVESRKAHKTSVERSVKRAESPGTLSANVQMPSWYDAIFEADREGNNG